MPWILDERSNTVNGVTNWGAGVSVIALLPEDVRTKICIYRAIQRVPQSKGGQSKDFLASWGDRVGPSQGQSTADTATEAS
jgi:hypothetical protein